ncbi:MAG: hypothetical protein H5T98_05875 [Syntrophomonadaceae bacterium]|nr:hypothetical protein [Syntrophomonadaceae bacterium]
MSLVLFGCGGSESGNNLTQKITNKSGNDTMQSDLDKNPISPNFGGKFGQGFIYHFYSPSGKYYISMEGQVSQVDGWIYGEFFLVKDHNRKKIEGITWSQEPNLVELNHVLFLNENTALLNGNTLFDADDWRKTYVVPEEINYIFTYDLSQDKKKVAIYGKDEEGLGIWVVDLENMQSGKIFEPDFPEYVTEFKMACKWDINNNLYFHAGYGGKPYIFKYSAKSGETVPYLENALFPSPSPDGENIAYYQTTCFYSKNSDIPPKTFILDMKTGEKRVELADFHYLIWAKDDPHVFACWNPCCGDRDTEPCLIVYKLTAWGADEIFASKDVSPPIAGLSLSRDTIEFVELIWDEKGIRMGEFNRIKY